MHRNAIIGICVVFCVVAVGAGWVVAGMSTPSRGVTTAGTAAALLPSVSLVPATAQAGAPTAASAAATTLATTASLATSLPPTAPATSPEPAPTAAPPTAAPAAADPGYIEYTIQKGDLLNSIAKEHNVTAKDILAINQIANPDSLVVGEVIRIPKK